jgi:hypothetical protein
MFKHLNKKNLCIRSIESFNISDDDIFKLSLVRIKNNIVIEDNDNNKRCNICNKIFSTKYTLLRHLDKKCNIENIIDKNIDDENNVDDININKTNNDDINSNPNISVEDKFIQNITNNFINATVTNNIINLNINILKSFDEDWDDSKIDNELKIVLLLTDSKYTKTLENLLENNVNLNVLIDNTGETGLIYKKNTFEVMDIRDIVEKSMEKIYYKLHKFHKDIEQSVEYNIKKDYLEEEKKNIDNKYQDYKLNTETKDKVINFMKNIYNKKKDETLKICNEIIDHNMEEGF